VRMLSARETRDLAPHAYADSAVLASLLVPREAVVDPFATCVAFAESAVRAGAHFLMEARPERVSEGVCVRVSGALEFRAKTLVNCAGLGARGVADLYGGAPFEQNPRRGQFLVYANPSLLGQILLPIPSKLGKGVLVAPTVFGQLIAGPTAEDLPMESADEAGRTTREGLEFVRHRAQLMLPALRSMRPFGQWAGARANCAQGSYLLRYNDGLSGCVTVAGVRSTGLSSSFALADALAQGLAASCGLDLGAACEPERARDEYPSWFQRPVAGGAGLARGPAREAAPEPTLCFCEGTTRSDISKALGSCLRPNSTDAVKRYTRATMGKCQGKRAPQRRG
jgi:glycerol-3-phosphate dehydrogenase